MKNSELRLLFRFRPALGKLLAAFFFLSALAGSLSAAERTTQPIVLAPPLVNIAPLPDDGSGTYLVNLDGAFGTGSLSLLLTISDGKVRDGVGLALDSYPAWMPVDFSGLRWTAGSLRGTALVTLRQIPTGGTAETANGERLADAGTVSVELDVSFPNAKTQRGAGKFQATITTLDSKQQSREKKVAGQAAVWREAPAPETPAYVELAVPYGLGKLHKSSEVALRAELTATGKQNASIEAIKTAPSNKNLLDTDIRVEGNVQLRSGNLTADLVMNCIPLDAGKKGSLKEMSLQWQVKGRALGRYLVGTVEGTAGEYHWQAPLVGRWTGDEVRMPGIAEWRQTTHWTWKQDIAADPKLAAQAEKEAKSPVFPGSPGKRPFWTWRWLVNKDPALACIYPPSLDVQPVEGATAYQVVLSEVPGGTARHVLPLKNPWDAWTTGWSDLPVEQEFAARVEALDKQGKVLSKPLLMGLISKESGQPVLEPVPNFTVRRKTPFSGPYAMAPRDALEAALLAGRWATESVREPKVRYLTDTRALDARYESGEGWRIASEMWGFLARRDLTNFPGERAFAESTLQRFIGAMQISQRASASYFPYGIFYMYKGYTPLTRYPAEALLDTFRATADERCREMLLQMCKALGETQLPGGNWATWDKKNGQAADSKAFWYWQHYNDFGAAELLYILGRIRTELKTEQFLETEKKALAYVQREQVANVFWPINVHHSMSRLYPVWQYPQATCYYIRYLLEHAAPADRDVALAVELGRWTEDRAVEWRRVEGPAASSEIYPQMVGRDRDQGKGADNALWAALAFLRLHEATGDALWLAKSDALVTSVLQAQCPHSGHINTGFETTADGLGPSLRNDAELFISEHCAQLLREYTALRKAIVAAQ